MLLKESVKDNFIIFYMPRKQISKLNLHTQKLYNHVHLQHGLIKTQTLSHRICGAHKWAQLRAKVWTQIRPELFDASGTTRCMWDSQNLGRLDVPGSMSAHLYSNHIFPISWYSSLLFPYLTCANNVWSAILGFLVNLTVLTSHGDGGMPSRLHTLLVREFCVSAAKLLFAYINGYINVLH